MISSETVKTVMVTGNLGYIGAVLTPILAEAGYRVNGLDAHFFDESCSLYKSNTWTVRQVEKDIRRVTKYDFQGIDAVIHLAALSNDPLGELNPEITHDINYKGTLLVAECAREAGVKRFVYVSSQSMYGISETDDELEEDSSEKKPLTAYAKAKWAAECALMNMNSKRFCVVSFRPSTVFGSSPKLRCDIVFNNLVGCAYTKGVIEIKSDGTPFRPVIHVNDVSNALMAGLSAPIGLVSGQAFNIGVNNGNYTVRQLAEAAARVVPETPLIFTGEHGSDARTYRVSFKKILTRLKDHYSPCWTLDEGGRQLLELFQKTGFTEKTFSSSTCVRLTRLKQLIQDGVINTSLYRSADLKLS